MKRIDAETLTFLFADVVGSASLWEQEPAAMASAVSAYDAVIDAVVFSSERVALRPRGEGDGRFLVFATAADAAVAALTVARRLAGTPWPTSRPFAVRMALHTGAATWRQGDYYGSDVNRAARLRSAAHAGQILLSRATAEAARGRLPSEASTRDLGLHRLKDLSGPERIYQLMHPDLPGEFPALQTLDQRRHNLPVALSDFVDRPLELAEVTGLLGEHRMVVIVGPEGCGKTRIALQAGADAVEHFPDGIWHISAAMIGEGLDDGRAIAGLAGLPALEDFGGQHVLFILDGCEDAPEGAIAAAERLLQASPSTYVLAASRRRLPIQGGVHWTAPGLAAPPPGLEADPEVVGGYPAVQLFVQGAKAARPDFVLTGANASAVAEICRRLDGNARAIETIAVRIRSSTPAEQAARLGRSVAGVES